MTDGEMRVTPHHRRCLPAAEFLQDMQRGPVLHVPARPSVPEIVPAEILDSAVLPTLPSVSVDAVITDPPYLGRYKDRLGRILANDCNPAAVVGVYAELYRVLKPNSFCVTFYGYPKLGAFVRAWTDAGFNTVGQWSGANPMPPVPASCA
jgi:hypothetical protein